MSDIAELGLKVDSGPVKLATNDLANFVGMSAKAQAATEQLAAAGGKSETVMRAIAAAAGRAGISTAEMSARMDKASQSAKAGAVALQAAANPTAAAGMSATAARLLTSYNMISLAMQTVSAASAAYFGYLLSQSPTVEKTMQEQDRLLGIVKDSYDKVAQAAKRWLDQSKDVTQLQLLQQQIDLQKKLAEEVGKGISGATTFGGIGDFLNGTKQIKENLLPFEDAVFKLQDGFKQGTPNVREFVDEVAKIALLNPVLQKLGADLITSLGDASKFENALKQVQAMMKAVQGGSLSGDDKGRLGLPDAPRGRTDPFDSQVNSINKHIAAMKADALAVDSTAGEHARLRAEAQLLEAAQQKGGVATTAQVERLKALGQAAADAASSLARAGINSQIDFGKKTSFLTSDDAAIAQRLKDIYGNDVPAALGSTEAAAMRTNAAMLQFSGSMQSGVSTALSDMIVGSNSAADAMRNLGLSVVRSLTDMIVKFTIITPLAQAFQSSLGGSGLFGGLFGGAGGAASVATGLGAPFPMFAAANGGTFGPGWGVVGERGPELIKVHNAGVTVIPNHVSKPYLPGFAEGGTLSKGGGVTRLPFGQNNAPSLSIGDVTVNVPPGTDTEDAAGIGQQVKASLTQLMDERIGYHLRGRGMLNR